MRVISILFILWGITGLARAQNPIVPGYFADPSIRYIDGKFYMSVTTDGYEDRNGEPFVWVSDDMVNWDIKYLNINDRFFWAPSMIKGKNGKYYMVHQNGVDYLAYLMESDHPLGPWKETLQIKDFDVELFEDPQTGQILGIGSWKNILYFDNDPASADYMRRIVKREPLEGSFTDFTEGPCIFRKDSRYYLVWAGGQCWLDTYNIRYAIAASPAKTYVEPTKKPLLSTTPERGLFGPGHSSVIEVNKRWFLFYHRQDVLRSPTCNYRFACAAELFFDADGNISKVDTLDNFNFLEKKPQYRNLALNKRAFTNSEATPHRASYATDGRNDTRWQAELGEDKWITVDLGKTEKIDKVQVDFEYFDKYYLYKIEHSEDGATWQTYADYTSRALKAYETRVSEKEVHTRYVRIKVLRAEVKTAPASVWEIKILSKI